MGVLDPKILHGSSPRLMHLFEIHALECTMSSMINLYVIARWAHFFLYEAVQILYCITCMHMNRYLYVCAHACIRVFVYTISKKCVWDHVLLLAECSISSLNHEAAVVTLLFFGWLVVLVVAVNWPFSMKTALTILLIICHWCGMTMDGTRCCLYAQYITIAVMEILLFTLFI